jgi:pentatricopeptide repeat protein
VVDDTNTSAGSGKRTNYSYNLIISEEQQQQQPSIMNELNQLHTLLSQCLSQDYSYNNNNNNNNDIDEQPLLHILHTMMIIYTKWCKALPYPSSQLRYKASAAIDISFRLVTNMAFSTTSTTSTCTATTVSWINVGLEAMQLQLYSKYMTIIDVMNNSSENDGNNYSNSTTTIIEGRRIKEDGGRSSSSSSSSDNMKLISLQRPYDTIHKGTWLRALRALTSKDMYSSSSSSSALQIRVLSSINSELVQDQMITPANAAYRILQRLINGRGIRRSTTYYNKRTKEDGGTKTQQQTQQQQQVVLLDERDFNMVLQAYATTYPQNSYIHAVHRVMALQERTVSAPPLSPVAYSILIKAYGKMRDSKNVDICLLNAKRNGVIPDIVMANTVLDAYVNCGLMDKAKNVFQLMTRRSATAIDDDNATTAIIEDDEVVATYWPLLRPNTRTYNTLLKGMAAMGDIDGAMKLSYLIQSNNLWDEITTNTLVKAAVIVNKYDLAERILSNHTVETRATTSHHHHHPNVEAYTELIDGYAKDGQLENSLRIMSLMQKRGVMPNVYTYTCIVSALARNNKIRQARKMINYCVANLLPSLNGGDGRRQDQQRSNPKLIDLTPTYNAFISGILSMNYRNTSSTTAVDNIVGLQQSSHASNMIEVLAVFQEMLSTNIPPNVVTVSLVVDGLGRCSPPRCKEARELVEHLESTHRLSNAGSSNRKQQQQQSIIQGISLSNNKIATTLIQAYGRANDAKSAIDIFSNIASPDVVALNSLLDVCCRCNELKLALNLLKKYVLLHPPVSNDPQNYQQQVGGEDEEIIIPNTKTTKKKLIMPDVVTFTTLISALLQLKSKAATKRATLLYYDMKQKWWITPDTVLVDT